MKSVLDFHKYKTEGRKIKMVTCYDHWSARILKNTLVDCLLVGDSLSMVVHGFDSTVHATMEMMALHTSAVARAQTGKLIVSDLPFLAHRKGVEKLVENAGTLMKAGANALKIETQPGQEDIIEYLSQSGVPVIGHLGLTPQYIHQLGGYKVQGRDDRAAKVIKEHALELQKAGAHGLVLECVPDSLAAEITFDLEIPTIGIGAGLEVDGQVLVLQDLLGFNKEFKPRFVRQFAQGEDWMKTALEEYSQSIDDKSFPAKGESFQ